MVRLTNKRGEAVTLSSLGAGIVAVEVADKAGKIDNVALSYGDPADYVGDAACMGKTPGRYAGRIANGRMTIDGVEYNLPVNLAPNHLHGGPEGFANKIWEVATLSNGVRFTLYSPAGEMGYPGDVKAAVEYRWNDESELSVTYSAESDAKTVVNLTNHAYWNLDGADAGYALGQMMRIRAFGKLATDPTLVPTGEIVGVDGTPYDFSTMRRVDDDIKARSVDGYDDVWVLDRQVEETTDGDGAEVWTQKAMVKDALTLYSPRSGRTLRIDTDQPAIVVYTANGLGGSAKNASGRSYDNYDGIAIEPQGFPDAPNHPDFPSQEVSPDRPYFRTTIYRFK